MKKYKRLAYIILLYSLFASNAFGFSWSDLWWRDDQQASYLFKQQKYSQAAERFRDPAWQGSAFYRAGDYQAALDQFNQLDSVLAHYNRGNALAKLGQFQEAIEAYKIVLTKDPQHADAQFNKKLLEQLLQQGQQNSGGQQANNSAQNNKQNNLNNQKNQSSTKDQQNNPTDKNQNQQDKKAENKNEPSNSSSAKDKSQSEESLQAENKKPYNPNKIKQDSDSVKNQSQSASARKREWQEATEQWLRRVPDEPGGLLRQKFIRDHLRQKGVE